MVAKLQSHGSSMAVTVSLIDTLQTRLWYIMTAISVFMVGYDRICFRTGI